MNWRIYKIIRIKTKLYIFRESKRAASKTAKVFPIMYYRGIIYEDLKQIKVDKIEEVELKEPVHLFRWELYRIESNRMTFSVEADADTQKLGNEAVYFMAAYTPLDFETLFGCSLETCISNPLCVRHSNIHIFKMLSSCLDNWRYSRAICNDPFFALQNLGCTLRPFFDRHFKSNVEFDRVQFGSPVK